MLMEGGAVISRLGQGALFQAARFGAFEFRNRIFMAPMTRGRADRDHVPSGLMEEHYAQRAGAGLIISEATGISRQGLGWPFAPGIWSAKQIDAWTRITTAVHRAGGKIICQLWHMGRVVHPSFNKGQPGVSASATTAPNEARTYGGRMPHEQARALETDEVSAVVTDFALAAQNAVDAGFDGIQLHAGSGYLIEQFLRDGTNRRRDRYGGSVENRIRFLIEIVEATSDAIGADRVSVRFSPNVATQGVTDSDPESLFTFAARGLARMGIAFLELREPGFNGIFGVTDRPPLSPKIRAVYHGPLVLNEEYSRDAAQEAIETGRSEAVSFGRAFISNPDLPHRFAIDASLTADDRSTWYTAGREGYNDYPAFE
jgi:N-ethylmaleimide reductase